MLPSYPLTNSHQTTFIPVVGNVSAHWLPPVFLNYFLMSLNLGSLWMIKNSWSLQGFPENKERTILYEYVFCLYTSADTVSCFIALYINGFPYVITIMHVSMYLDYCVWMPPNLGVITPVKYAFRNVTFFFDNCSHRWYLWCFLRLLGSWKSFYFKILILLFGLKNSAVKIYPSHKYFYFALAYTVKLQLHFQ